MCVFRSVILGNHKYLKGLEVLDVGDALYNPLDPEEVIAFIHPAGKVWGRALMRLSVRSGEVRGLVMTDYGWGCGDLNAYPEEGLLLTTYCVDGVVELRDLKNLELKRRISLRGVGRVASAVLDSSGTLWVLGSRGLYLVMGEGSVGIRVRKVLDVSMGVSMDSQRAEPAKVIAVADHLSHRVLLVGEDGGLRASIPTPFPGGVRFTHDERLIISSGRLPTHVQLTLIYGATHLKPSNPWFGYLWDYGTLASNRADSWGFEKVLIQWSLSALEVQTPLPKFKPYIIPLGSGSSDELLRYEGFKGFTPAPALGKCILLSKGSGKISLEVLKPKHSFIYPKEGGEWITIAEGGGGKPLNTPHPGLYRVKVLKEPIKHAVVICS